METVSEWASFGGRLSVHDHASEACRCTMRFAVYTPPQAEGGPVPVLWYLSGLTCTWANVMEKSGIQRAAARHGLMVVAPDTSPRGEDVADDDAYDLGQGAGFYVNATESPWSTHYHMYDYVTEELPKLVGDRFAADLSRQAVTGHSMGGHGALVLHLRHPDVYRSCSAFAPVSGPSEVPWGQKAFETYLGGDKSRWAAYDATELVQERSSGATLLIDTGDADSFLSEQLRPQRFVEVCERAGQPIESRMQPGHDHSYYFIATFMDEHVEHHARALKP